MKALSFSRFGDADVLEYKDIPTPDLKDNEVLVEMRAIGLNYADIYRRKGQYHLEGKPPYIAGYEGAGIIIRSASEKFKEGDRVAFADVPLANAEVVAVPESNIIPIAEDVDFNLAASLMLQGLTAHYLSHDSHKVQTGDIVLIHAASGGVGQILTQICKLKGATVIGLSRKAEKLDIIRNNQADHALELKEGWQDKIMELTWDRRVDVVYDSVGSTLKDSFSVTKDCGHVVFYGMSGGDPQAVDPRMLMDRSLTLSGGDLWSYLTSSQERIDRADELLNWIAKGKLKIGKPQIFKLSDGKNAHIYLEGGKSSGKVLLIPDSI